MYMLVTQVDDRKDDCEESHVQAYLSKLLNSVFVLEAKLKHPDPGLCSKRVLDTPTFQKDLIQLSHSGACFTVCLPACLRVHTKCAQHGA